MFTLAVHAAPPHPDGVTIGCSWEGVALPNPPAGGGMGEPGFPIPLPAGVCSRETVMRMAHHAAMPMTWERGRPARAAGTAPAPSLTLPHRGREPGSSPQRGEAGRGAERGERCSR